VTAATLIGDLRARGFSLVAANGELRVSPAAALTAADRVAIRSHLPGLLAALAARVAGRESPANRGCSRDEAIRLMFDADALVEQLGIDGRLPAVQDAAAVVTSAFATRDMETLRLAVAEFGVVVRTLAGRRVTTGGAVPTPACPGREGGVVRG
jgi:hypothetical protein